MSGADSPEILEAYDAVRSDKDDTKWLLVADHPTARNKLALADKGTGGLEEVIPKLEDDKVQYAYVRVEYANDAESKRIKFALIVWIGQNVKPLRRGRVLSESADVKKTLSHYSIQVDASSKGDLEEKDIVARLRKAGGADYNGGRG
ncbi:Actin depolymerizing protein [Coniochaeta hoffmannii]|uniref:Actin depolymerizing protein n=1 Tax=Coniochaeta hoffmannii TaxID=91930 RepID=A0AA38S5K8_9PEZI|nr:Actin depolymerizing protein [Coniochaeta hoffmannii]